MKKIVLGYSGGLDTTYCLKYLQDECGFSVICVTLDLGQGEDLKEIKEKAERMGCAKALIIDAREDFAKQFLVPAIQCNALYQNVYPLATALGRPFIGYLLAKVAREEDTKFVSHGCTGKGNDQVRIELAVRANLADAEMVDPIRDNNMNREQEIDYLRHHNLADEAYLKDKVYSVDQNLWGRSICAGVLEDPWSEPPPEVYAWTVASERCPKPVVLEIAFEHGIPVALDGRDMSLLNLIEELNVLGGSHGVGRIDHIEDRIVGIKSREIYEAPAALILIAAHRALDGMVLTKRSLDFKESVSKEFAEIVYGGSWFSTHTLDILSYLFQNQKRANGVIRVKLDRGNCMVVARKAEKALYNYGLATYSAKSTFDQKAATHFIEMYGQQTMMDASGHLLNSDKSFFSLSAGFGEGGQKEE